VGPDIYSRVFCARDERTARRAGLSAAAVVVPLSFVLALLGLLIRARFPDLAPEAAFPEAVSSLAPAGLRGLIIVGILGAIMSSADTTLISASTILSLNVVSPLTDLDARGQLRLTRVFVVLVGVAAWGVAAFEQGIIASLLLAYAVFVGGVALPTLVSFWRDRLGVTSVGALWAILLGGGVAVLGKARNGEILDRLVGDGGVNILETTLGPEYGSILPLVLSALLLLAVGRRWRKRGVGVAVLLAVGLQCFRPG
jgi:SSS family solute:Na+ symporter